MLASHPLTDEYVALAVEREFDRFVAGVIGAMHVTPSSPTSVLAPAPAPPKPACSEKEVGALRDALLSLQYMCRKYYARHVAAAAAAAAVDAKKTPEKVRLLVDAGVAIDQLTKPASDDMRDDQAIVDDLSPTAWDIINQGKPAVAAVDAYLDDGVHAVWKAALLSAKAIDAKDGGPAGVLGVNYWKMNAPIIRKAANDAFQDAVRTATGCKWAKVPTLPDPALLPSVTDREKRVHKMHVYAALSETERIARIAEDAGTSPTPPRTTGPATPPRPTGPATPPRPTGPATPPRPTGPATPPRTTGPAPISPPRTTGSPIGGPRRSPPLPIPGRRLPRVPLPQPLPIPGRRLPRATPTQPPPPVQPRATPAPQPQPPPAPVQPRAPRATPAPQPQPVQPRVQPPPRPPVVPYIPPPAGPNDVYFPYPSTDWMRNYMRIAGAPVNGPLQQAFTAQLSQPVLPPPPNPQLSANAAIDGAQI